MLARNPLLAWIVLAPLPVGPQVLLIKGYVRPDRQHCHRYPRSGYCRHFGAGALFFAHPPGKDRWNVDMLAGGAPWLPRDVG